MSDFDKEKLDKVLERVTDELGKLGLRVLPAQQIGYDPGSGTIALFVPIEVPGPAMDRLVSDQEMNEEFLRMMQQNNVASIEEKKAQALAEAEALLRGEDIFEESDDDEDETPPLEPV
jgi:hypothetical protein